MLAKCSPLNWSTLLSKICVSSKRAMELAVALPLDKLIEFCNVPLNK